MKMTASPLRLPSPRTPVRASHCAASITPVF